MMFNSDEIAQTVRNAAYEIMNQIDTLKYSDTETLREHLIYKSKIDDNTIVPRDVLFNDYVINIAKNHMGEMWFDQFGWCVASAIYNLVLGYDINGGTKGQ